MRVNDKEALERCLMHIDIAQHLLMQGRKLYNADAICNLEVAVIQLANACSSTAFKTDIKYESYSNAVKSLYASDHINDLRRYGDSLSDWFVEISKLLPDSDVRRACCTAVITFIEYMKVEIKEGGVSERLNVFNSALRSSLG